MTSLYNLLALVFGSSHSSWDSALVRGRQPLGTELCGFDRAGRQTQHAKSSGPFEMSRQEARLREKQGYSPHSGTQRLPGTLLPLPQEPKGWVLWGLGASSGHVPMEVRGACQVKQTYCHCQWWYSGSDAAQRDLEVDTGRVNLASGLHTLVPAPVWDML